MLNIYLINLRAPWMNGAWMPLFWASAKTYYELHGTKVDQYNWITPIINFMDFTDIANEISKNPPDIFACSLYMWNSGDSLRLCAWVKKQYPDCLIILGGPQQTIDNDIDFFKKNDYIDAVILSSTYGEVSITNLLDNYSKDMDWNQVIGANYPSTSRALTLKSTRTESLPFEWNFSEYASQKPLVLEFYKKYIEYTNKHFITLLIETTRGCPYSCTFCDWGQSRYSKMKFKDVDSVKASLDILRDLPSTSILFLHIVDANTGIGGQRDVDIFNYLSNIFVDKTFTSFNMALAGFAKSTNHLSYVETIVTMVAENNLLPVYKLSLQSLSEEVLTNIKRINPDLDRYLEIGRKIHHDLGRTTLIEFIIGLPGETLNSFYTNYDVMYKYNICVAAYNWSLLPGTEAYTTEYREKFKLETVMIDKNTMVSEPTEIVVGSYSYSRTDYKEMLISISLWELFSFGGIYKTSIEEILFRQNWKFSTFLRKFREECFSQFDPNIIPELKIMDDYLNTLVTVGGCKLDNCGVGNHRDHKLDYRFYLIYSYWFYFSSLDPIIRAWLHKYGANVTTLDLENQMIYCDDRKGKTLFGRNFTRLTDITQIIYAGYIPFALAKKSVLVDNQ